jgi:hypothetical protein
MRRIRKQQIVERLPGANNLQLFAGRAEFHYSLLANAAAPNASPGFTKFRGVVLPWVKQKRCAAVYLPTVSKISHLIWLHNEALRLVSRDLGDDDPPIPPDFIERVSEWNEVTLGKRFDLNGQFTVALRVMGYEINASDILSRRHYIPTQQRQSISGKIQADIAYEMFSTLKSHSFKLRLGVETDV